MARKQSDEDILSTARERFKLAEAAEAQIRKDALDDLRFCSGEQWDSNDVQRRRTGSPSTQRPCLVFNKLIGPLNQTANEARMNSAGIEINPVDSASDPDTAQVIEGMIRHIESVSKADEVYETALEQSAAGSFGYFKVTTRFCGPKSFEQELRIERVADPFTIYTDPFAMEADKSDMGWAFETEMVPRDDYLLEYPDSELTKLNFYSGLRNPVEGWVTDNAVRIARYWMVEKEKVTIQQVEWPDGKRTSVYKSALANGMPPGVRLATDRDGKTVERDDVIRTVKCLKINGAEILDETDWPGQWIPILPVLGKEMYVNGERKLFSLVRFAKDPQRLYNFYRSSEAETVLLGTKAPWVGVKGAFRDKKWESANTVNYAYLEYEPLDIAGNPAPPPQRNVFEPPIQALSLGAAQAADDIKATTGIFDASLGSQGNETSGVAIRQRQSQTGMANAHFIDNLNRAIRQCGRILCDAIPRIYDTAREVRILGEDRMQQIVMVNQPFKDWPAPLKAEMRLDEGKCYDLQNGQYDVVVSVGNTAPTQRQETWQTLTQLAQAYPQLMQVAGDLIFETADFPGADKIADRLRKTLPPGLADQPVTSQQQMQVLAAQAQQMSQTIDQLTAALTQTQEALRTKAIEHASQERIEAMKIQSHEKIEFAKIKQDDRATSAEQQTQLVTTAAKLGSAEDINLLKTQIAVLQAQLARMATGAAADRSAGNGGIPSALPAAAPLTQSGPPPVQPGL